MLLLFHLHGWRFKAKCPYVHDSTQTCILIAMLSGAPLCARTWASRVRTSRKPTLLQAMQGQQSWPRTITGRITCLDSRALNEWAARGSTLCIELNVSPLILMHDHRRGIACDQTCAWQSNRRCYQRRVADDENVACSTCYGASLKLNAPTHAACVAKRLGLKAHGHAQLPLL